MKFGNDRLIDGELAEGRRIPAKKARKCRVAFGRGVAPPPSPRQPTSRVQRVLKSLRPSTSTVHPEGNDLHGISASLLRGCLWSPGSHCAPAGVCPCEHTRPCVHAAIPRLMPRRGALRRVTSSFSFRETVNPAWEVYGYSLLSVLSRVNYSTLEPIDPTTDVAAICTSSLASSSFSIDVRAFFGVALMGGCVYDWGACGRRVGVHRTWRVVGFPEWFMGIFGVSTIARRLGYF